MAKKFLTPIADELKLFLSEVEKINPADFGEFAEQITVERQTVIDSLKLRIEKQEEIDRQAVEQALIINNKFGLKVLVRENYI